LNSLSPVDNHYYIQTMGGAQSTHKHHHHHQNITSKIGSSYNEDGVIVLSDEELQHMWVHYDENKNNLLDEHEIHLMVDDLIEHTITDSEERKEIRAKLDNNGNFVHGLMEMLDKDKDGVINFNDFKNGYHEILNHYLENWYWGKVEPVGFNKKQERHESKKHNLIRMGKLKTKISLKKTV